ncbi:MAG: IPT/TIG domain-containing protein [Marinisporobacter sp.]|jgi:hypothetical protein|nr:IPT/TIG domain-containing protein [Marinisporobacter sp.]
MKKYKEICLILAITLIFMGIPIENVYGETTELQPISYSSSINGEKDIRNLNETDLEIDGSIYIKFLSNIQNKDTSEVSSLINKVHIFKVSEEYTYDLTKKEFANTQLVELSIGEVQIDSQYKNIIKIKPGEALLERNQYKIIVDQESIVDEQGNGLEDDLTFTFWTKSSSNTSEGNPSIIENSETAHVNQPKYGIDNPIILHVDKEVIPVAEEQEYDVNIGKFYDKALKNITLLEIKDENQKASIEKVKLEYYTDTVDNVKKTKILLYPIYRDTSSGNILKNQLDSGKGYKLTIPEGILETRSNQALGAYMQYFYVETDPQNPKIDNLENNQLKVTDLYNSEGLFSIIGQNFHEKIKEIKLHPFSGKASKEFIVLKDGFELKDATKIDVHIKGDNRTALSNESNTGSYEVWIDFDETPLTVTENVYATVAKTVYGTYLQIESKGKPTVKTKYPQSIDGKPWYDEKNLKHDVNDDVTKDKYFVKATFDDLDNQLGLTTDIADIKNCIIRTVGGLGNLIDTGFIDDISNMDDSKKNEYIQKYIFVKSGQQATLYIPVKALRAQTNYQVIIPSGMVHYKDTFEENDSFEWVFTTTSVPLVKEISVGTIPEDYDEDEPIYVEGDFFSTESGKIKVYFDDIEAEDVTVVSETQLKVYLPDGSDRLGPGTYDIIVENDNNHKRTIYGSLGVVKSGDKEDIPNEEYKIKGDSKEGEVRSNLKVSEDTLFVSPSDINENVLEFDLDELMGKDTFLRKLQYDGDKKYSIGMLKTKSKWANIILYGVTLDPYAEEDEITIRLGRTEPSITQMLKRKLRGKGVVSDFIQVSGENYKMKNVQLQIPLKYSNGKHIKVLRYDEMTRNFYETEFTVNLVDKKVEMICPYKGIYMVVTE